ncbi:MAG: M50 family metallopeptidase [Frankia sp.]
MRGPELNLVFSRIGETQAPLPAPAAALIGFVALLLVFSGADILLTYIDTMAHEGAHALVGWGLGQKILGVAIVPGGDGATWLRPGRGVSFLIAGVVGYFGPSGFGLGGAKLISMGHPIAALWTGFFLLVLLSLTVKNPFSILMVLILGGLTYLAVRYAGVGVQVTAAYALTWVLLFYGLRTVVRHNRNAGDALILAQLTHIPRTAWAVTWFAGSAWALLLGGDLLVVGR